jgi:catalase (peroxidase I)
MLALKAKVSHLGISVSELVLRCIGIYFRGSDKRGGANAVRARIRLEKLESK